MNAHKIAYKPVGLIAGALAGVVAGVVFKQVWKHAAGQDTPPRATDPDKGWTEVLMAAALQGAIFALVKATVDRGGAHGYRQLTGRWPD